MIRLTIETGKRISASAKLNPRIKQLISTQQGARLLVKYILANKYSGKRTFNFTELEDKNA